jgi:hypothetical protein
VKRFRAVLGLADAVVCHAGSTASPKNMARERTSSALDLSLSG